MPFFLALGFWNAVTLGMTKRMERLLVTSNFLTFAMIIALWIRTEAGTSGSNSSPEEQLFLELEQRQQQKLLEQLPNDEPEFRLGDGLFPDSWRWSPGGLARNYPPPPKNIPPELPTWATPPFEDEVESVERDGIQTAQFEKAKEIWYQGYLLNKLAEEKEVKGDLAAALKHFDEAEIVFHRVSEEFPDFHSEIVKRRILMIKSNRLRLKALADSDKLWPNQKTEPESSADFQPLRQSEVKPDLPHALSNDDASDIWYRAYIGVKKAEELEAEGDLVLALSNFNQAEPLLRAIAEQLPSFHPEIVKKRIQLIRESQARLQNQIRKEMAERNRG